MTRRLLGLFVAAAFALGLFSGVVGTAVAHDGTRTGDDMASMMSGDMASMMSGDMASMMSGDMASMMSGSMPPGGTPGSQQHELHHPGATQDGRR